VATLMGFHKTAAFAVIASGIADATGALPAAVALDHPPVAPALFGTRQAALRTAHRHEFDYTPRPGYLYVRSRAISSRCNDNYDEFPAEEIKAAYASFVGKPVFVNHHNANHRRARGVIIDAALHEDSNPDGTPDTWCEVLMEVDALRFPKLAEAVISGAIDRTSMGTDVAYSVCTACGNKASNPTEYCAHIPRMKGQRITRRTASGSQEAVLVAERCYGLRFFENSLLVEQPADPTAFTFGLDTRGLQSVASARSAVTAQMLREVIAEAEQIAREANVVCSACNPFMGYGPDMLCGGHSFMRKMDTQWGRPTHEGDFQVGPKPDAVLFPTYASGKGYGKTPGWSGLGRTAELEPVEVAGLAIQAADTGRVLMIQRSFADKDDPARGTWEFPGGHLDDGEHPPTAAIREFSEEVGCEPPHGDIVGSWRSGPIYQGFHMVVPTEADINLHCKREDRFGNPDDPDGDDLESVAWWLPEDAKKNPALRPEVKSGTDWSIFRPYVRKATAGWESLATEAEAESARAPKEKPYWDDDQPVPDMEHVLQRMLEHAPWNQPVKERHLRSVSSLDDFERDLEAALRSDFRVHLAYGEQKAPAQVDTLRESACPVCGADEGFNGTQCLVCQYVKPPDKFGDPDLDKAKQVDLRGGDTGEDAGQALQCPNCGATFQGSGAAKAKTTPGADPKSPSMSAPTVDTKTGGWLALGRTLDLLSVIGAGNPFAKKDDGDAAKPKKDATEDDAKPDPAEEQDERGEAPEAVQAGDTCPDCGVGVLEPAPEQATDPAAQEAAQPDPNGDPTDPALPEDGAGDEEDPSDPQTADEGQGGPDDEQDDEADDANPFAKKKKPKKGDPDDSDEEDSSPFKKKTTVEGARVDMTTPSETNQPGQERKALLATVQRQQKQITALIANDRLKDKQIEALRAGLVTIASAAGVGDHPKFALLKTAEDEKNDEVATTDEQALAPAAKDDVESVGAVPAPANTGVTPDGVTDVQNANVTLPTEPFNSLVDVTAPTSGTDTVPDNHVVTDVKAGTPSQEPFDNVGGWTAAKEDPQTRFITSMRLAKMRKSAGLTAYAEVDELSLGEQINGDAALPLTAMLHEVDTLSQVIASRDASRPAPRNLVPQSGARAVPSLSAAASVAPQAPTPSPSQGAVTTDEFLF
jgi:8-oxo-dGTP pyrophosphatase MutT (NUDIX family)